MNMYNHGDDAGGAGLRRGLAAAAVAAAFGLAGCAVPAVYRPTDPGARYDAPHREPYRVEIAPATSRVILGEPVVFRVRVVNGAESPVWIPRDPAVVLTWIYPSGVRDNLVKDLPAAVHFGPGESLQLGPGESIERMVRVRTDAFPRPGLVEFRAVVSIPRNTNPELDPFPGGRFVSNAYGVQVALR